MDEVGVDVTVLAAAGQAGATGATLAHCGLKSVGMGGYSSAGAGRGSGSAAGALGAGAVGVLGAGRLGVGSDGARLPDPMK